MGMVLLWWLGGMWALVVGVERWMYRRRWMLHHGLCVGVSNVAGRGRGGSTGEFCDDGCADGLVCSCYHADEAVQLAVCAVR